MVLEQLVLAVCTFYLCWYLLNKRSLPSPTPGTRHPPCLTAIPVVGSLPFLKKDLNDLAHQLMEKSKSLGTVFALYTGSKYAVVLNGADSIKDALLAKSTHFAGRSPKHIEQHYVNTNLKGIISSTYDNEFRRKHRFYLSILKRFGFGKHSMETRINDNVKEFIKEAETNGGRPFDPAAALAMSMMTIITDILVGRRHPYGHPPLVEIKNLLHAYAVAPISSVITLFPFLRFLPQYRRRMNDVIAKHQLLHSSLGGLLTDIMASEESVTDDDDNDNFVRHFITQTKSQDVSKPTKLKNTNDDIIEQTSLATEVDREELFFVARDLYLAGTETSVNTLRWFFMEMAKHREIQNRMREEVDYVVRRDRLPSLNDEQSMPYSQAVILETMRRHTLVPLSLLHSTMCDTSVGDFFVPANTTVIVNLYSVHMDPTVWKDPDTFRPERFLDGDGAVCGKDWLMPFSLGKRSCLGETLARQELFLFMTAIIQRFVICPPEGQQQITCGSITGATHQPMAYEVRLIPRHH